MDKLSAVVLFGGIDRWRQFGRQRLSELVQVKACSQIVVVVNPSHREVISEINQIYSQLCLQQGAKFCLEVILSPENNIPMARNLGVRKSNESVVMICDDDDRLDPLAVDENFSGFVAQKFKVMEMPLAHNDGSSFHPQAASIMPQKPYDDKGQWLVMGMLHTPFLICRELIELIPFPENMALRGDWLEWSTHLWRAGIPIFCSTTPTAAYEGVRDRLAGATASSEINDESLFHILVSMIFICAKFGVNTYDYESDILCRRYLQKYFGDETPNVWLEVSTLGSKLNCLAKPETLSRQDSTDEQIWERCLRSYRHCYFDVKSRQSFPYPTKFLVRPFEMFSPKVEQLLRLCLAQGGF